MRTVTVAFIGGIVGTIFASFGVLAWTGPTSVPPNGNVAAPLNTGTTDQVKDAGLALNALAVFGNAILSGASRYLSFGNSAGQSGYGIRDNAGTMEFKNSGGAWASFLPDTGVQSITFADGTTQMTAADADPVAFNVYAANSQTLESPQRVTFDSKRFDTANAFNLSTERFTPTTAGYYSLTATIGVNSMQSSRTFQPVIYKNGAPFAFGVAIPGGGTDATWSTVNTLADANGTTDYFEVYVFHGAGSLTGETGPEKLFFAGSLVR